MRMMSEELICVYNNLYYQGFIKDTDGETSNILRNSIDLIDKQQAIIDEQQKTIKKLEQYKEHEQKYIQGKVFSTSQINFINDNYISKKKIQELVDKNDNTFGYNIHDIIDELEILLEEY